MAQIPIKKRRRALRLRDYDYKQAGAYFVTICAQERACLFGVVQDGKMRLNDAGRIIGKWWLELNRKFPIVETDEFVIMPNHLHGIVIITDVPVGADLRVGPGPENGNSTPQGAHTGAPLQTVIQWFKTMTTNEYIRGVKRHHGCRLTSDYGSAIILSTSFAMNNRWPASGNILSTIQSIGNSIAKTLQRPIVSRKTCGVSNQGGS